MGDMEAEYQRSERNLARAGERAEQAGRLLKALREASRECEHGERAICRRGCWEEYHAVAEIARDHLADATRAWNEARDALWRTSEACLLASLPGQEG